MIVTDTVAYPTPTTSSRLRTLQREDAEILYAWRTDTTTVANSFGPPPTSLAEHEQWLSECLNDSRTHAWILEIPDIDGSYRPAAVAIYRCGIHSADVSIMVDPAYRGRGLGRKLLAETFPLITRYHGIRSVRALIKAGNLPSRRAFEAASFEPVNGPCLLYERRVQP